MQLWEDDINTTFFYSLKKRLEKLPSKDGMFAAVQGLGNVCFTNTRYSLAICDGVTAGDVAVDNDVPKLQTYSRGGKLVCPCDDILLSKGNCFYVKEELPGRMLKKRIYFVSATAHGPSGSVALHFWIPDDEDWMRATYADFKRHYTKNPLFEVANSEEPQVYPPRPNYISYFSQPAQNFSKQSPFFAAPNSRRIAALKTDDGDDIDGGGGGRNNPRRQCKRQAPPPPDPSDSFDDSSDDEALVMFTPAQGADKRGRGGQKKKRPTYELKQLDNSIQAQAAELMRKQIMEEKAEISPVIRNLQNQVNELQKVNEAEQKGHQDEMTTLQKILLQQQEMVRQMQQQVAVIAQAQEQDQRQSLSHPQPPTKESTSVVPSPQQVNTSESRSQSSHNVSDSIMMRGGGVTNNANVSNAAGLVHHQQDSSIVLFMQGQQKDNEIYNLRQ